MKWADGMLESPMIFQSNSYY